MKNRLFDLSAKALAKKIRLKEISPIEVVHSHISLLEQVNPQINAICEKFLDRAIQTARQQTEFLNAKEASELSDLPPLFGVPFTVKEMFDVKGARRTGGSIHRRDEISAGNATLVQRLIDHGAILLATTNVPELGFWFECSNPIYGQTSNPYDLRRTCGGSSGGEGAIIGSGASPFGLGSDIGGSVRLPAYFCGIFGHKPTPKTLPLTGHFPFQNEDFENLRNENYTHTSVGTLCRKAEDLEYLFDILTGPDDVDRETIPQKEALRNKEQFAAANFNLGQIEVHYLAEPEIHLASAVDRDVSEKVSQVAQTFLELGCNIDPFDRRFFVRAVELWGSAVKRTKNRKFSELLQPEGAIQFKREFFNLVRRKPNYTLPTLSLALMEDLLVHSENLEDLASELDLMRKRLNQKLGPNGVLVLPVFPRVAPKHHQPLFTPFDFIMSGIFTVLGFPSVSIPLGLNSQGIPTGVQIVASPSADQLLFRLAEVLENLFGGWVQPKL